jgi:UDP-N-acetylglucosamine--N-acetylmuramyl-(pentapeptide) pyrophosphoryl-undecaprenol N-acetylglucosamine transferase
LIFATLGTHHDPFLRAIDAALVVAGDAELVVQHGHTEPVPAGANVRFYRWLVPDEINAFLREATLVITHAGVASVVAALRAGHHPIVIARRRCFGEHVDDHQLQIVSAVAKLGLVTPFVEDVERAAPALTAHRRETRPTWPPPGLKATVRTSVFGH